MSALENVMAGRHLRERCALLPSLLRTPALARAEAAGPSPDDEAPYSDDTRAG